MFRLITRRTWNHDIRRKSLFAYLHDKGVLDDWNIEQIKIGYSFSRPTLNHRQQAVSHWCLLILSWSWSWAGCWLVSTLQVWGMPHCSGDWGLTWSAQPGQRWGLQLRGPGPQCFKQRELSSAVTRPRLPSTHYAFIIWFERWQGQ